MKRAQLSVVCLLVCFAIGCAHVPLKRNVVKQSNTLADIYEQQVLNGIATFCVAPNSTPSFALPTGGGTTVNQSGSATGGLNFNARTFTGATTGLSGSQQLAENWTLKPINDPVRLNLMKCVYQYVTCNEQENVCIDCQNDLRLFFGDDFADCKLPRCFFRTSPHKPRTTDCCIKSGQYCGTHVIVDSCNFASLSKLTMAILDIATVSDDQLAKRLSRDKAKTIEIDTTFIANIDGRPQLIHGKYTIPFEKFEDLQDSAIPSLESIKKSGVNAESIMESGRSQPLKFKELNASPAQGSQPAAGGTTPGSDSSIQSLLQMNQLLSPR